MNAIMTWLFTARPDLPDPSFNWAPWLIVIAAGLLIPRYYWVEGRRKIPWIKNHTVWKQYILDRLFSSPQLPLWAFVGLVLLGAQGLDTSFFSWRFWLVIWVGWGVAIAVYWLMYFIRQFPQHMVAYERFQERAKYLPGMGRGRRR